MDPIIWLLIYGLTHLLVSLLIVLTHKCAQSNSFISVVLLWLCSVSVVVKMRSQHRNNSNQNNQNRMCFRCEKQLLNAKDLAQKISVRPFSITAHPDLRVTRWRWSLSQLALVPRLGYTPEKWPVHRRLQRKQAHKTQTTVPVSLLHSDFQLELILINAAVHTVFLNVYFQRETVVATLTLSHTWHTQHTTFHKLLWSRSRWILEDVMVRKECRTDECRI